MGKIRKIKKKRKMANNLTLPHWDSNPRFLNKTFPPNIWSLREIRSIQLKEVKIARLYRSLFFYYRVIGQAANCIERSLGMKFSMENLKDTSFDENEDNSSGMLAFLVTRFLVTNQLPTSYIVYGLATI